MRFNGNEKEEKKEEEKESDIETPTNDSNIVPIRETTEQVTILTPSP